MRGAQTIVPVSLGRPTHLRDKSLAYFYVSVHSAAVGPMRINTDSAFTIHDQHHRYFKWNYGGYTPIWDWICGTVRPSFVADYEQIKARVNNPLTPVLAGLSQTLPES